MRDTTVAARYAKALFLVTEKRQETAVALPDLKAIGAVLEPGSRAGRFFASPEVGLADKRAVLRRILGKRVRPVVVVFVDLLLRKKRLRELPFVVGEFEALVERAQGLQRAHLVSAAPIGAAALKKLQERLERYTHARIQLTAEIDPELLGGALVRIGDRVIDRSVRTLLRTMEEQLREVSV